ncbi:trehalose synthase (Ccg-9) [Exophiala viscosa]|uniref:Trehalose synthase (Ccg-9) n=1 Tax=Exophiala viscosa TaxID=2486360 RepID=A0AAN6DPZ1_9EURO|nr:trehalose synthase (Ccg-9) [Exophiala viscosa]
MAGPEATSPRKHQHRRHSTEVHRDFVAQVPEYHRRQSISVSKKQPDGVDASISLSEFWAGVAIQEESDNALKIGVAIHDGTYSIDFAVHRISLDDKAENGNDWIADHIISELFAYRKEHLCKLLGAGVTLDLFKKSPTLCSRLWAELDIVPFVLESNPLLPFKQAQAQKRLIAVDEIADSAARKCLTFFAPTKQPRLSINYQNQVEVDLAGMIQLTTLEQYEKSVREPTWRAVQKHIKDVKDRNLRVAFFSATPQGGGVALMRHALLRFLTQQGVNVEWFVPKPRPDVFRITKTNHNILQGAVPPDVRATDEQLGKIKEWIQENAVRFWLSGDGPLSKPEDGGADVIIIDDPQMPELIPIAKREAPNRPIIFRCHIEVRDDLVLKDGSAAQHVWRNMWSSIKQADIFLSHPVRSFVPPDVKKETLGWLPATTDWLDGLNKSMDHWDLQYYLHVLRQACMSQNLPQLAYPERGYFTQVARFDPSKGIPDVIKSYARYRELMKENPEAPTHQLVICGHSSIDDPDGTAIYDETMDTIKEHHSDLVDDIVVVRLGPSDQILNAIMSLCTVALQLSTREGFEVKVSEALHKGKPIIATLAGGIPLQVEDSKSGYLVERGDHEAVAKHLYDLVTDHDLYQKMSDYAMHHVSDEVHTVGNALSWMFLASSVAGGESLKPNERWINDLAREAANEPYKEGEPRLPRHLST